MRRKTSKLFRVFEGIGSSAHVHVRARVPATPAAKDIRTCRHNISRGETKHARTAQRSVRTLHGAIGRADMWENERMKGEGLQSHMRAARDRDKRLAIETKYEEIIESGSKHAPGSAESEGT